MQPPPLPNYVSMCSRSIVLPEGLHCSEYPGDSDHLLDYCSHIGALVDQAHRPWEAGPGAELKGVDDLGALPRCDGEIYPWPPELDVELCRRYIREHCTLVHRATSRLTSTRMAALVTRWAHRPVGAGAFIVAGLMEGYTPLRVDAEGPDVFFNLVDRTLSPNPDQSAFHAFVKSLRNDPRFGELMLFARARDGMPWDSPAAAQTYLRRHGERRDVRIALARATVLWRARERERICEALEGVPL